MQVSLLSDEVDDASGRFALGSRAYSRELTRGQSKERQTSAGQAALISDAGGNPRKLNALILMWAALVVVFGTSNRIAYKIMLVPLERYPYLVGQISAVVYTVLYLPLLLYGARQQKMAPLEPLKRHWRIFVVMGVCDGVADVLGLVGARDLPGTLLTLLPKIIIPCTMILSRLVLGTKYSLGEVVSVVVVLLGVVAALFPVLKNGDSSSASEVPSPGKLTISVVIYLVSVIPNALSFVLKELVFTRQPGLTVFAISFYGSFFQLLTTLAILPLSAVPDFGSVPLSDLPTYAHDGLQCWAGVAVGNSTCVGAPEAPITYHSLNLAWNIALVILLKLGGATLMFVANTVTFPFANLLFGVKWPLLGADKLAASPYNAAGLVVELSGVCGFQYFMRRREARERPSLSDR